MSDAQSAAAKLRSTDPAYRAKLCEAAKRTWQEPAVRALRVEQIGRALRWEQERRELEK